MSECVNIHIFEGSETLAKTYSIMLVVCSSILILAFGWLLYKIRQLDKGNQFAVRLTTCMLVFNIATLARFFCTYEMRDNQDSVTGGAFTNPRDWIFGILRMVFMLLSVITFSLGNWYFGFHYYKASSEMKFKIISLGAAGGEREERTLEDLKTRNKRVY